MGATTRVRRPGYWAHPAMGWIVLPAMSLSWLRISTCDAPQLAAGRFNLKDPTEHLIVGTSTFLDHTTRKCLDRSVRN